MILFKECHEEAIHIPGKIQSFGYLIGIDASTRKINFISENLSEIFYFKNDKDLLGKRIENFPDIFLKILWSDAYKNLDYHIRNENEAYVENILLDAGQFYFTILRTGDTVFFEFEKIISQPDKHSSASGYASLYSCETPDQLWKDLLKNIDYIIGYDRMVVYRFFDDGSGKVIAERKKHDVESLLNLHYPEFDIPEQARALYLKNKKRIFSNSHSKPCDLFSENKMDYDLSFVSCRAMSPIHAQYLKNARICSSFSTSIIVDGKLWGLVTCHNFTPKHIDNSDRIRAEVLTLIASNIFTNFEVKKQLQYRLELSTMRDSIHLNLLKHTHLKDALEKCIEEIQMMPEADGIAISIDNHILINGKTPEISKIENLIKWSQDNLSSNIYLNHRFNIDEGKDLELGEAASGIMISMIDKANNLSIIWFRNEYSHTIEWAGKPEKIAIETKNSDGEKEVNFSPRLSFEVYLEQVVGQSVPWGNRSRVAAEIIQHLIFESAYSYYNRLSHLNEELEVLHEQMDNFSNTISHDLSTPLTVMKLHAQMLLKTDGDYLANIDKTKSIIDKIDEISEMLSEVSRLNKSNKTEVHLKEIKMQNLIEKLANDSKNVFGTEHTEIVIDKCINVLGDTTMVSQVFQNTITNAVKYSSKTKHPKIRIWSIEQDDKILYFIEDNGIGIAKEEQEKVFKPYSRTENALEFKGLGVGLSIVKNCMKKMGGHIDFSSEPNVKTTFILSFKKP